MLQEENVVKRSAAKATVVRENVRMSLEHGMRALSQPRRGLQQRFSECRSSSIMRANNERCLGAQSSRISR